MVGFLPNFHDTFLSAQYLVNLWLDSYQIFMGIYLGHNKELIRSGDHDLIFKVTAAEKQKIHGVETSVFSENSITSFGGNLGLSLFFFFLFF